MLVAPLSFSVVLISTFNYCDARQYSHCIPLDLAPAMLEKAPFLNSLPDLLLQVSRTSNGRVRVNFTSGMRQRQDSNPGLSHACICAFFRYMLCPLSHTVTLYETTYRRTINEKNYECQSQWYRQPFKCRKDYDLSRSESGRWVSSTLNRSMEDLQRVTWTLDSVPCPSSYFLTFGKFLNSSHYFPQVWVGLEG